MVLALYENLSFFTGQTRLVGSIDRDLDGRLLAFVGTIMLVQMLNLPFILMKDNKVLGACHWETS
jgi:hypothetical protein